MTGEATLLAGVALTVGFGIVALVSTLVWSAVSRGVDDMSLIVPWQTLGTIGAVAAGLAIGGALLPAVATLRAAEPGAAVRE